MRTVLTVILSAIVVYTTIMAVALVKIPTVPILVRAFTVLSWVGLIGSYLFLVFHCIWEVV